MGGWSRSFLSAPPYQCFEPLDGSPRLSLIMALAPFEVPDPGLAHRSLVASRAGISGEGPNSAEEGPPAFFQLVNSFIIILIGIAYDPFLVSLSKPKYHALPLFFSVRHAIHDNMYRSGLFRTILQVPYLLGIRVIAPYPRKRQEGGRRDIAPRFLASFPALDFCTPPPCIRRPTTAPTRLRPVTIGTCPVCCIDTGAYIGEPQSLPLPHTVGSALPASAARSAMFFNFDCFYFGQDANQEDFWNFTLNFTQHFSPHKTSSH